MSALVLLMMIVAVVGGLAYFGRLSSEIERLSKRLGDVERKLDAVGREARDAPPATIRTAPPPPQQSEPAATPPPAPPRIEVPSPPPVMPESVPPPPAAPAYGGVEQAIGTKWAVWVGGAALALGGIFLVRYTIEAGLLGPGVRVALGGLLAAVLALAGEWTRRREPQLGVAMPSAYIPGVLTAAAIVVAFGTIYAAHALYGFLGPGAAFLLLGATGLASMLAALRHGPALAGLGLAASYATPLLVVSPTPSSGPLVLFLAVVAASAYMLARARRWLWLATVAVAGAIVWGFLLYVGGGVEAETPAIVHTLVQLALAVLFMAVEPHLGTRDEGALIDPIASMALAGLTLLVATGLSALPFEHAGWLPLAAIAMAILTIGAWASSPAATASALAGLIVVAVAMIWTGLDIGPDASRLLPGFRETFRLPSTISTYLVTMSVLTAGLATAATLRLWRGSAFRPEVAVMYAGAATLTPLVIFVIAYLRITQFAASVPFAAFGIGLAALLAWAAGRFERHGAADLPGSRLATGAFAAAALAALSLGLTSYLERGYLTVAFALAAWGTAWVCSVRDIPLLRYAITALGAIVIARVVYDPRIMGESAGTWPILNWLLVGYGIPALAFWHSARMLRPGAEDAALRLTEGLALLFTTLLVFFQIRHLMNGGDPLAPRVAHVELGLHVVAALGLMLTIVRLDGLWASPVWQIGGRVLGGLGLAAAVVGLGVLVNPLFSGDQVGGRPIVSSLLLGYLLPGLMALFAARQIRTMPPVQLAVVIASAGLVLILLYVSLTVRQAFQGPDISIWNPTSQAEHWAHSVAWLALGVVILLYGLWRGAIEARIASGLLVALAAIKIAVFDLADVEGLWRALSFLCLGAVLIGIGMLYQRLIFGRGSPAAPPVSAAGS
ncbi:MAG: DUF2339 domain-containing protein [Hyphomicrobiaceae bacterium]